ncbi:TadE/TadG family type IV pilus assembly protein [Bacillus daqingensis]|uniref:TadE/TadG family type IV pilus assembly protein n=1 Tax=Bacillus daqingensis TaxID=872396 RepID=A0ABV9NZH2_9BACI
MMKKQSGQSMVEFAIMLPVFLLLVVGIVDFGRVLYTHLELELVAQESARLGGFGETSAYIDKFAKAKTSRDSALLEVDVKVVQEPDPSVMRETGKYVIVTLEYPEEFFGIFGQAAIPYTVRTSSTIRIE